MKVEKLKNEHSFKINICKTDFEEKQTIVVNAYSQIFHYHNEGEWAMLITNDRTSNIHPAIEAISESFDEEVMERIAEYKEDILRLSKTLNGMDDISTIRSIQFNHQVIDRLLKIIV